MHCSHEPYGSAIRTFFDTKIDRRLYDVWRDMHAFACLSNLAFQTTRKLSAEMYNQTMISVHYKLCRLGFRSGSLDETLRLGLLNMASTMFVKRQFMDQSHICTSSAFGDALHELMDQDALTDLPPPIAFWLATLSVITGRPTVDNDWRIIWLRELQLRAGIDNWTRACEMLRSVVWVDFLHGHRGKEAFGMIPLHSKVERSDESYGSQVSLREQISK